MLTNSPSLQLKTAKILAVGAGGIGCELLKSLALTGFEDIEVVRAVQRVKVQAAPSASVHQAFSCART